MSGSGGIQAAGPRGGALFVLLLLGALAGGLRGGSSAWAQEARPGPLAFILPAGDSVVIVLGDTPRLAVGFNVSRLDPGRREYTLLTPRPLGPVADPYRAAEMMGADFRWVARQVGSLDPPLVWRKLRADRDRALALCLVSHGLRKAMGRTFIDDTVLKGGSYRYRVELLDGYGRVIDRIDKRVQVRPPQLPAPPREVKATASDGEVTLSWSYPPYRGRADDLTVGFRIYRREQGGQAVNLTPTPVLRIEGWLSYVDSAVENGKRYSYLVEAVDLIGAVSSRTASPPVRPLDRTPPLVPAGLKALDREEGVLVLWRLSPELDAVSYNVFRSEELNGEYRRINTEPIPVDRPRYLDREITRGRSYFYRLSAVDRSGNESPLSGPTTVLPADTEAPPQLSGLEARVDDEKRAVILSWKPAEAGDLEGYFVYRDRGGGKAVRLNADPLPAAANPSFSDSGYKGRGLAPGAHLRYGVSAVDNSGNEGPRVFVEVTVPDHEPPKPPLSISARSTPEGSVRLRWQPGLEKDLAAHRIYRAEGVPGPGREFTLVAELPRPQTEWIDERVTSGTPYRYRLTEMDTAGNESEPSRELEIVPADVLAPEPPASVTAAAGRRGVQIDWEPSPSPDAAGYLLYRAAYPGAPWQRVTDKPLAGGPLRDRRGQAGNLYGVSAVDRSGNEGQKRTAAAEEAETEAAQSSAGAGGAP